MSIEFSCECGRQVRVKPELAGKKIRCPGCGNPLRVPADSGGDAAPAEPPTHAPKAQEETRRAAGKTSRVGRPTGPIAVGKGGKSSDASEVAPTRNKGTDATRKKSGATAAPRQTKAKTEFDIKPLEDQGKTTGKKTFPCPGCGAALYVGDIMCITCGMDLSTGQWVLPKPEVSLKASLAKLVGGLLLTVGVIVGVVWWLKSRPDSAATNAPANRAAAPANAPGDAPVPAAERIRQDVADPASPGLASLAALLKEQKGDALPVLAEQVQDTQLPLPARRKAMMGIALLARRGWISEGCVPALDAALGDADADFRAAALETLWMHARPTARTMLDAELAASAEQIPRAESVQPAGSALQPLLRPTADFNDALYFRATGMVIFLGQSSYAGNLVELLRNPPPDASIPEKAARVLAAVSGRGFTTPEDWVRWWDQNSGFPPVQWLIDALESEDATDRPAAHERLVEITGNTSIEAPGGNDLESWKVCAGRWREATR